MSTRISQGLSIALMAAGLGWLAYVLATQLTDPSLILPASWSWLAAASILVLLSIASNGILFYLFLQAQSSDGYSLSRVLIMHFSAQLLRYLPGRVWGIVYQINTARGAIPAHQIARANLDWMAFSLVVNTLVALLLIAFRQGWPWWGMLVLVSAGLCALALLFLGGINWLFRITADVLPERLKQLLYALAETKLTPKQLFYIGVAFGLSWVLYLAGWMLLGKVFPVFAQVDFIVLCAYYTLAAVLGIMSAITPAGLGVREAAFLMLAAGSQGTEAVAFFALFGRVWLMLLELTLLMVPLGLYLNHRRDRPCH